MSSERVIKALKAISQRVVGFDPSTLESLPDGVAVWRTMQEHEPRVYPVTKETRIDSDAWDYYKATASAVNRAVEMTTPIETELSKLDERDRREHNLPRLGFAWDSSDEA